MPIFKFANKLINELEINPFSFETNFKFNISVIQSRNRVGEGYSIKPALSDKILLLGKGENLFVKAHNNVFVFVTYAQPLVKRKLFICGSKAVLRLSAKLKIGPTFDTVHF